MTALLIIAHAPLASSLKSVAAHFDVQVAAEIEALDVPHDLSPAAFDAEVLHARQLLDGLGGGPTLVLTDIVGGSPSNIARALLSSPQVRVVAGASVPMLCRAMRYRAEPVDAVAERVTEGGRNGVVAVGPVQP